MAGFTTSSSSNNVQSAEAYKRTVVHVECKQNIQCGGALKKSSWANSTAELTALAF